MNQAMPKTCKTSRPFIKTIFMKKISVFLLGAVLVGVASAFTTVQPKAFTIAYGFDGSTWHQVNVEDAGITYVCDPGSTYCLYDAENGNPLPGQTQNQQFRLITP